MSTPDLITARRRARFARRVARARKRGMVLLVTVSLLTLFLLIGVTYAVVAVVYRDAARSNADRDLHEDPPEKLLESAFYTLIRDPSDNDVNNPLRGHGILRDKYGASVRAETASNITAVPSASGGQSGLLEFSVTFTGATPPPVILQQMYGHYAGCVLTFLSGPMKNVSTRIVQHDVDASGNVKLVIVAPEEAGNQGLPMGGPVQILINGREFAGAGAGFNFAATAAPWLSDEALRPNRKGDSRADLYSQYLEAGANESYDAADYQNPFLAALVVDPSNENNILAVLPSFHDRALISFKGGAPNKYQYTFRPTDDDPFLRINTAAFPQLQSSNGPWTADVAGTPIAQWVGDVDNDNDGIPDSVWVDVGLPIRRSKSGRLVKPLVAFLCLDMEGRFNANFHGKFTDALPGAKAPRTDHAALAGGVNTATLPEGAGFGPPEISLNALFNDKPKYDSLLLGNAQHVGRYGTDQRPGRPNIDYPGTLALVEVPSDYFDAAQAYRRGTYMSAPDPHGRLALGVNPNGSPHQPISTAAGYDERTDTDYELRSFPGYAAGSAGSTNMVDQPFTPAELEAVLRQFDSDSLGLPQRLRQLVDGGVPSRKNRLLLTTDSYDSPAPSLISVGDLQTLSPGLSTGSFSNLASKRLIQADGSLAGNPAALKNRLGQLFSWELLRGEKMDLNRPFGNGVDDSNPPPMANGYSPGFQVCDEFCPTTNGEFNTSNPKEFLQGYAANVGAAGATTIIPNMTIVVNHSNNNANLNIDPRQVMARHLYCLGMLLKSQNALVDLDADGTNDTPQEVARAIAQWAVNVVDFRDADSINTGFEYDINPWDGWGVDGDISAPTTAGDTAPLAMRGVVWGCERPELVMTETLFMHDRKTEDTEDDDGRMTLTTDPNAAMRDPHFDQRLMPEGLGYIELFNPWMGTDRQGAELSSLSGQVGVQLDRTDPVANCPVWRILVVRGAPLTNFDPDAPAPGGLSTTSVAVERSVYFTNYSGLTNQATTLGVNPNHGLAFYPNIAGFSPLPVGPGRYAVIGSSGRDPDGTGNLFTGYIGRNTLASDTDPLLTQTRRIVLDTTNNTVQVFNPTAADPAPAVNVSVLPINSPRSFNISDDPSQSGAFGYGGHLPAGTIPTTGEPLFDPPVDLPFDQEFARQPPTTDDITIRHDRMLYLQRLANPLQPWNPNSNPYLTVDSRPADLTCYNGLTTDNDPIVTTNPPRYDVGSFEQGHEELGGTYAGPRRVLWRRSPLKNNPGTDTKTGAADHFFDYQLKHSLGFLNRAYHPYVMAGSFIGSPDTSGGPAFPWLTFLNRPLNGPLEILSVPRTSQSQLMERTGYGTPTNMYNQSNYTFGHLMNYWHSSSAASAGTPTEDSLNLHRIFDFVTVPSRFADARRTFNFVDMQYDPATGNGMSPFYQLSPPFNWVSNFRDPAKPNINTVYSPSMWNAILKGRVHPTWNELVDSRRGYGAMNDGIVKYENLPTFFANPFRGEGSGGLVPASLAGPLQRPDVDTGLLRTNHITPSMNPTAGDRPLFADTNNTQACNDFTRQPYFHSENLHRMSNLVGTRSNVFAIWLTVGYFEVDQTMNPPRLGAEIGSQTGEVKRHRAFYIFDRSIPVAFEPGENHNVDKAVLVRRMIE